MKRIALFASLVLLAGCATSLDQRSANHIVIPASQGSGQTAWTPSEADLSKLEYNLGILFNNPDTRITGLPDLLPPYPLSDYVIRYTVAGPKDSIFLVGEAVHKSRPEARTQLDATQPGFDPKAVKGTFFFTVLYDVKLEMIREVHFNL